MNTKEQQSWQTTVREVFLEPFLPPPILRSIRTFDDTLQQSIGLPEATITIASTVLFAWLVVSIMVRLTTTRNKRALKDVDDEDGSSSKKTAQPLYDATVLLTGARNSGKTRLFYQLVHPEMGNFIPTVTSLKENIDYSVVTVVDAAAAAAVTPPTQSSSSTTTTSNKNIKQPQEHGGAEVIIRYIDYPGYASIYNSNYIHLIDPCRTKNNTTIAATNKKKQLASSSPPRIVLVVDATQPVTVAAEILFQLFTILYDTYCNNNNSNNKTASRQIPNSKSSSQQQEPDHHPLRPKIFVACHKKDHSKAKNEKRIKIQIRTELERLIYSAQMSLSTTTSASPNTTDTTTSTTGSGATTTTSVGSSSNTSGGWWSCPPRNSGTNNVSRNSLAVDLDELAFVQLYFYATTCSTSSTTTQQQQQSSQSNELLEFCTTGTVTTTSTPP